jgi:hypothetical protein
MTPHPITQQSIRQTMNILREIDPVLYRNNLKLVRGAGQIIATDAKRRIPDVPTGVRRGKPNWGKWGGSGTSGHDRSWSAGRARKGIRVRARVKKKGPQERPLLDVIQTDAAGAIFDMAGKSGAYTRGPRGVAFNRALTRHGRASRSMWPAAEANQGAVLVAMDQARRLMEAEINARLGARGATLARII